MKDGESTIEIEVEGESGATVEADVLDEVEDEVVDEIDSVESSFDEVLKPEKLQKIKNKWNDIVGNDVEIIVSLIKIKIVGLYIMYLV